VKLCDPISPPRPPPAPPAPVAEIIASPQSRKPHKSIFVPTNSSAAPILIHRGHRYLVSQALGRKVLGEGFVLRTRLYR